MHDLTHYVNSEDSDDDQAITIQQRHELKKGVRSALENGERVLMGPPSDLLSGPKWSHAGIGISVYVHHGSGVVVLDSSTDEAAIVTDTDFLDHVSTAQAKFEAETGGVMVVDPENE